MLLAHQRADEDHAIYVVHPKELEVLQLPLGVVSGVRQKHLIGRVAHCLGDAIRATDSELIFGTMTPMRLLRPVRRVWAEELGV